MFISKAQGKSAKIGIGLGESLTHNLKILNTSLEFIQNNDVIINIFGNKVKIEELINNSDYKQNQSRIILIESANPEKIIIDYLIRKEIDATVRGSLNSSKFLKSIELDLKVSEINRLTLLETYEGFQFFYGPVGIDECNNLKNKIIFIKKAVKELEKLNITPKISILSGGRHSDIGRDAQVDETIKIAKDIISFFKKENPNLLISHDEILIENAIENQSNLIIAPDGISGNLIYRTLVHLGGGKAHGAIYMDIGEIIIDTSRVGNKSEIHGALLLALALTTF